MVLSPDKFSVLVLVGPGGIPRKAASLKLLLNISTRFWCSTVSDNSRSRLVCLLICVLKNSYCYSRRLKLSLIQRLQKFILLRPSKVNLGQSSSRFF